MIDLGEAKNLGELLDAAHTAEKHFGGAQVWFRGHVRREWRLVPSAYRRHPILESQMANHFRHRASGLGRCPPHRDYARWLPLMRHYGLPTRLLDWSESICVAAYFAHTAQAPNKEGIVWIIAPGKLNVHSIGDFIPFLTHQQVMPIVEAAFTVTEYDLPIVATLAPRDDPRMLAQIANFTIHGNRLSLEEHTNTDGFLARVAIPASAQDRMGYDLSVAGMRMSNLFPDLEHLATEIADLRVLGPDDEDMEGDL